MSHATSHARQTQEARRQWELGQAHAKAARWEDALHAHAKATRLAPHDAVYALNHARALLARGEVGRAGEEARRAYRLDPECQPARDFACECLMREQRFADAVEMLRALDEASRRDHAFHAMLGMALHRLGRPNEAVAAFFDALALQPSHAATYHNLGLSFTDLDMKQEASHCFNTALLLGVGTLEVCTRGLACYAQREGCEWSDSDANVAALKATALALPVDACVPTAPFAHAVLGIDRQEQLKASRSCARFIAQDVQSLPARRSDWQPGQRPVRVGYVSADFHAHATAILMAEMLERHDRSRFEIHLYSHGIAEDSPMRRRIEVAADRFNDVRRLTDLQVAQRIRADGIDLLIDLKGHTRDTRLSLFAYRAAPLQATFLGFPGTTGADYIDYLIGDVVVTPLEHAADYSEKIAQMPVCYQPNDRQRRRPEAPTRASQGLPEDALVLCGFNQPYKVSPEVFDSWCRLLQALPDAVLWVLEWTAQALPNLRREAASRGVDPARLVGAPRMHPDAHIARLQLADIFIDTWPCNAHTTASDALWAGVPIVTLIGETFASRVGASLLQAVGTPELVCHEIAQYETTVRALAGDRPRRQALRKRLAKAREDAPLFDTLRYTRDIEGLYLRMAERHVQGLAPEHLPADS